MHLPSSYRALRFFALVITFKSNWDENRMFPCVLRSQTNSNQNLIFIFSHSQSKK